ncbi:alpha-isopropylmalate synthase regulatory domain-containing protein, partial [Lysobacter sp. 2RAB21]
SLPTASVQLVEPEGSTVSEAAVGDGPVHALFAALARATGVALRIDSYNVSSVTTGDDAQGQASVTARVNGVELTGSGTSTDIIEASALAWLEVANRVHRTQQAPQRLTATA